MDFRVPPIPDPAGIPGFCDLPTVRCPHAQLCSQTPDHCCWSCGSLCVQGNKALLELFLFLGARGSVQPQPPLPAALVLLCSQKTHVGAAPVPREAAGLEEPGSSRSRVPAALMSLMSLMSLIMSLTSLLSAGLRAPSTSQGWQWEPGTDQAPGIQRAPPWERFPGPSPSAPHEELFQHGRPRRGNAAELLQHFPSTLTLPPSPAFNYL